MQRHSRHRGKLRSNLFDHPRLIEISLTMAEQDVLVPHRRDIIVKHPGIDRRRILLNENRTRQIKSMTPRNRTTRICRLARRKNLRSRNSARVRPPPGPRAHHYRRPPANVASQDPAAVAAAAPPAQSPDPQGISSSPIPPAQPREDWTPNLCSAATQRSRKPTPHNYASAPPAHQS